MARFGKEFVKAATQPAYLGGLFTAARNIGAEPARAQRREELSQFNPKTVEGLTELAEYYQSEGDVANAAKYATASRTLADQEAKETQLTAFQEQVATAAESAGLTEQAKAARSTRMVEELRAINDDVRKFKISQLPLDNPAVINAQLRMAGFTPAQITAMGTVSKDEATALIEGRTGDLEAWVNADGQIRAVNVNKFGLVFDNATKSYKQASELGLVSKAPSVVQQIVDNSQQIGSEKMAEANVDNFVELNTKAQDARDMIELIDRQTGRLEGGMPTGLGANVELNLRRFGELIGFPYDPEVTNAETFISEAGKIVADQIKDFGSGTGLSDADREYAKLIAAADITTQQEALLELLKIRRGAMVETVQNFNSIRSSTAKRVGEQNMTSFPAITMPEKPKKPELLLEPGFVMDQ